MTLRRNLLYIYHRQLYLIAENNVRLLMSGGVSLDKVAQIREYCSLAISHGKITLACANGTNTRPIKKKVVSLMKILDELK